MRHPINVCGTRLLTDIYYWERMLESEPSQNPQEASPASSASSEGARVSGSRKKKSRPVPWGRRLTNFVRQWAWRLTGMFVWFRIIGWRIDSTTSLNNRLTAYLMSAGFTPINTAHFATMIKIGWVLVITAFKPLEIVGLAMYLFFFPIAPLFWYLNRGIANRTTTPPRSSAFGSKDQRRLAIPVCSLLLLGWLVLFGNTTARNPAIAGAILSGALFLLFALRAFQRVRPVYETESPLFRNFLRALQAGATALVDSVDKQIKENSFKTRDSAIISSRFQRLPRRFLHSLAVATRGRAARNRIYVFVLGEYLLSLLLLASSAILFWAMADKAVLTPSNLPLSDFVALSATSVFPSAVQPTPTPALPKLMLLAPSITAWILFVLYVGPASAIVSYRQEAYARSLAEAYRSLRKLPVMFSPRIRRLEALARTLP
jgi:hypothetical protein